MIRPLGFQCFPTHWVSVKGRGYSHAGLLGYECVSLCRTLGQEALYLRACGAWGLEPALLGLIIGHGPRRSVLGIRWVHALRPTSGTQEVLSRQRPLSPVGGGWQSPRPAVCGSDPHLRPLCLMFPPAVSTVTAKTGTQDGLGALPASKIGVGTLLMPQLVVVRPGVIAPVPRGCETGCFARSLGLNVFWLVPTFMSPFASQVK